MGNALPLRVDYDAADLRKLARRCRDDRQSCRLLAIASIYEGMSRADAARIGGMDRQTLRDWVLRFNEAGPQGLKDRWVAKPRRLSGEQMKELAEIVETGPDPDMDGIVRWRRVDLQAIIEDRFGVVYHERTISKLLAALGFSHISARPRHPAQNAKVIEAFKKTSPARSKPT